MFVMCLILKQKPSNPCSVVKDENGNFSTDWDVRSCESFVEEHGIWSNLNPGLEVPA